MRTMLRLVAALAIAAIPLLLTGGTAAHAQSQAAFAGRWIDVDLGAHTATAYEGSTPVYTAPVSGGRPGFESPTGTFRIQRRVLSEVMDSSTIGIPRNGPGGYYVTNVMYTQYFTSTGAALHGNYWAPPSVFGRANTSHGCIGMRNSDAAFFWNFATYGTPVVVHW